MEALMVYLFPRKEIQPVHRATSAKCEAAKPSSDMSCVLDGSCYTYRKGYFSLKADTNLYCTKSGYTSFYGFNIHLSQSGSNYKDVNYGKTGFFPAGTYKMEVCGCSDSTNVASLGSFTLEKKQGTGNNITIGDYTTQSNWGDNGYRTTSGVSKCSSSYSCMGINYTFSAKEDYIVKTNGNCL